MLTLLRVNLVCRRLFFINVFAELSTEECLIDFRELLGRHTGENIADAVWETLGMFDIQGKVNTLFMLWMRFLNLTN